MLCLDPLTTSPLSSIFLDMNTATRLTLQPNNNRFNALPQPARKGKREKGERIESNGDGTAKLYIDDKFTAIIQEA